MSAHRGLRTNVGLFAFAITVALAGALVIAPTSAPSASAANPPTTGSVVVNESFTGNALPDTAWASLGSTCLTGATSGSTSNPTVPYCGSAQSGPVPTLGVTPGYLQLNDTTAYSSGTLLYNRSIPAAAGISIEFEQYQYGGSGADGIGFFVVDGATNLTHTGGVGGSLGYAQRYTTSGIVGGYIGVGFDVFGNYYDDGEGKGANCPTGQMVTLTISASNRGPDPTTTAVVTSPLPAGLSFVGAVASAGSFDETSGIWTIGALNVDAPDETLVITAKVVATGSLIDSALISSTFPVDTDSTNNSVSLAFAVAGGSSPGGNLSATGAQGALTSLISAAVLFALGSVTLLFTRRRLEG